MIDRIAAVSGNFSCGKGVFRLLQTGRGFLNSEQVETDWSALKVTGSLDFSLELPKSTSSAKKEGMFTDQTGRKKREALFKW